MALFNLFGNKKVANSDVNPVDIKEEQDVNNENPVEDVKDDENKKKIITITWGTGMPIDVVFNFIHKNFEEEGFQDALINQDVTYRDTKVTIIKNDLMMLLTRISLCYKNEIRDIDTKIDNARKALALGAASRLQAHRETFVEHLEQLSEMQQQLLAEDPKMTTMIESYRRGFMKGITASAINFIENN